MLPRETDTEGVGGLRRRMHYPVPERGHNPRHITFSPPWFCGGATLDMLFARWMCEVTTMQVFRWGNSLAIRLPQAVVEALGLREGDDVILHAAGKRTLEIEKAPDAKELLAMLRRFRGRLPKDFRFDRLEANGRH